MTPDDELTAWAEERLARRRPFPGALVTVALEGAVLRAGPDPSTWWVATGAAVMLVPSSDLEVVTG